MHCVPLSQRLGIRDAERSAAVQGVWVEKSESYFSIYVSWVAADTKCKDPGEGTTFSKFQNENLPSHSENRNRGGRFAGFSVITEGIMNTVNDYPKNGGEVNAGISIYPTVSFEMVGVPSTFIAGGMGNAEGSDPVAAFNLPAPTITLQ